MSIFEINGSAILAMKGDGCVAICADRRVSSQASTISTNSTRIFRIADKIYLGLSGLLTDVCTVANELKFKYKMYKLREQRDMSPKTFTTVVSNLLYSKR